jgi:hypothetical protein
VAENDDLTLWDLEIEAYNAIPTSKKRLITIGGSTHMTLYSDRSLLTQAGTAAAEWFSEQLGGALEINRINRSRPLPGSPLYR